MSWFHLAGVAAVYISAYILGHRAGRHDKERVPR